MSTDWSTILPDLGVARAASSAWGAATGAAQPLFDAGRFLYNIRSEMSLSTREDLSNLYQAATSLGADLERVPQRALRSLHAALTEILAAEGLERPVTESQRERLTQLQHVIAGHETMHVNLAAHERDIHSGLTAIYEVFQGNAPTMLVFTSNLKKALLSTAQDAHTSFHTALHLMRKARSSHRLEPAEARLLSDALEPICADEELVRAHFPLDFLRAFKERIDGASEPLAFTDEDYPEIDRCLDTIEGAITHKQGVIAQVIQSVNAQLFDPRNGILGQAISQLETATSDIVDEYTARASDTLVGMNAQLLRMLSPRPEARHARAAFSATRRLLTNASSEELLNRALSSDEKRALEGGLRHLLHLILHKNSTRDTREHVAIALRELGDDESSVIAQALAELENPSRDGFERRVYAAVRSVIEQGDSERRTRFLEALDSIPVEEEVLNLSPSYLSKIARAADVLLAGTKSQHGKLFRFVENLKEELAHPQRGVLPNLLNSYLKKVGSGAIKLQSALRRFLEGKVERQYQIDTLLEQLIDVQTNFQAIFSREPTRAEMRRIETLRHYFESAELRAEGAHDTTSPAYRASRDAATQLIESIDREQGELQRQLSGVLEQADGLVSGISDQVDRMLRTVETSSPLVQLQLSIDVFKSVFENNLTDEYSSSRRHLIRSMNAIQMASTRDLGMPSSSIEFSTLRDFIRVIPRHLPEALPEDETGKERLQEALTALKQRTDRTMRAHPKYGEMQAAADSMTSYLEARLAVMAGNLQRTVRGALGGAQLPGFGSSSAFAASSRETAPQRVAMRPTDHPTYTFMQTTARVLENGTLSARERKEALLAAVETLRSSEPELARRITERLPRRNIGKPAHFKRAVLHAIARQVSRMPRDEQPRFFTNVYLLATDAPRLASDTERITWAQTHFESGRDAYTRGLKALANVQAAHATVETHSHAAAPASATPATPTALPSGSEGMLGGLFGAVWSFLERGPEMAAKFSLENLMTFAIDKLQTTVKSHVETFEDIEPHERAEVLGSIESAISRIARGKETGSLEGYKEAISEAAQILSRHTFLVNGLTVIPSFDEPSVSEEFRALEARHIAELERQRRNGRAPEKTVSETLIDNKMRFIDVMSMYTTYQYIFGYRAKPVDRTKEIEADIEKTLLEKEEFKDEGWPRSRAFLREQALERRRRIAEFTAADKDDTLEEIMRTVATTEDSRKNEVFRDLICLHIDRRTDINSLSKWFLKNITLPLLMGSTNLPFIQGIIPYFAGQSIDSVVENATQLIHEVTDGNKEKKIDKNLLNGITGFIDKYDRALDEWARNGGERTSTVEGFLFRRSENNGFSTDELYSKLATLLIEQFYIPTDLSQAPSAAFNACTNFIVTPPFSSMRPEAIVGNFIVWPFKAAAGLVGATLSAIPLAITKVLSWIFNSSMSSIMKEVLIHGQVMQQITTATEDSIYGSDQYRRMLNNVIVDQLKAAWDIQNLTVQEGKVHKELQLVPKLIPNESIGRKKIQKMLTNAWEHLKHKVDNIEMDNPEIPIRLEELERLLDSEDIDAEHVNGKILRLSDELWRLHSANRTPEDENLEPEKAAARKSVSQFIQRAIDVLDKDKHLHPARAREPGFRDRIRMSAREEAMDYVVDSVTDLLLIGIESLLDKDLMESQLSGLLEAATDGMLYKDESDYEYEGSRPDARQAQDLLNHYLDLILRQAVDSSIDDLSTTLKDQKIEKANNIINAMKITLQGDAPGLRTTLRVQDRGLLSEWNDLLTAFEASPNVRTLEKIIPSLSRTLTEFDQYGRGTIQNGTPLGEQLSGELERSRRSVVETLHTFQKDLEALRAVARRESESGEDRVLKEAILQSLNVSVTVLRNKNAEQLLELTDASLEGLLTQAAALKRSATSIMRTSSVVVPFCESLIRESDNLKKQVLRLKQFKQQWIHISNIDSLVERYNTARLRELAPTRGLQTGGIAARGVATESNVIFGQIEEELAELEKTDRISTPQLKRLLTRLRSEKAPERLGHIVGTVRGNTARIMSSYKTNIVSNNQAVGNVLLELHSRIRATTTPSSPRADRESSETLLRRLRRDLRQTGRVIDHMKCPAVVNFDVVDLSPESAKVKWIKEFAHKELHQRAGELVSFVHDETVFKGLWHHAAGMLVNSLDTPSEVAKRKDLMEQRKERS